MAELHEAMQVLDVGCGIGGPARTLAAEYGCHVTGIDLTEEFCHAAQVLTARLGMSDRVTFRHGNALDLPFDDGSFDLVWTQSVLMNIEDKRRALGEMRRVLHPQRTTYTVEDGLAHDIVTAIAVDGEGVLWFGVLGGGVSRFQPE